MRMTLGQSAWSAHGCGVGAALLVTAAGGYFGVRPAMERAQELRAMVDSISDLGKSVRATESAAAAAKTLDAQLAAEIEESVMLQPAARINERLADLTARAEQHGLTVEQISPGAAAITARATAIPIRLSGSCTYAAATQFLRELRAEYRDMAVVSLQVSGQPAKPGEKASCAAEFVWFAAPAVSAASAGQ